MRLKYLKFIDIGPQDIPINAFCAEISILFPWDMLSRIHIWVASHFISLLIPGDNFIS